MTVLKILVMVAGLVLGGSAVASAQPQPIDVSSAGLPLASATAQAAANAALTNAEADLDTIASAVAASTPVRYVSTAAFMTNLVKNAAGTVDYISISNQDDAVIYCRLYNKATAPDPSVDNTTGLLWDMLIPLGDIGGQVFPGGAAFGTGIGVTCSKIGQATETDETALAADDVVVNIGYR